MTKMKINSFALAALLSASLLCSKCHSQPPEKMNSDKWMEDIQFLNKKIQKDFESFTPGIKDVFDLNAKELSSRISTLKDNEIKIELMRLVSTLKDGHTEINVGQKNAGFHRIPLVLNFFKDQLYVVNAHEQYKDLLGARVVGFGGRDASGLFDKLKSIISQDNEMEFFHAGPGYLILTELLSYLGGSESLISSSLSFELSDGRNQTITLTGLGQEEYVKGLWLSLLKSLGTPIPLYLQNPQKNYWYEYMKEDGAMYFHFKKVSNQDGGPSLSKFTTELFNAIDKEQPKLFIIDLRNNTGGNYHLSEKLIKEIKSRAWLNQQGKVWAITGKTTFSAALTTCIFLKRETNTTLIGEPGRGNPNSSDNIEYMYLPHSKLKVEYTTKIKKHWPELGNTDHIPVDVSIQTSFEQYIKGNDPILEFILRK